MLVLVAIGVHQDFGQRSVMSGDFFVEDYARLDLKAMFDRNEVPFAEESFVKNGPILRISVYGSSEAEAMSRFDSVVDDLKIWGRRRATREAGEPTNLSAIRGPYLLEESE